VNKNDKKANKSIKPFLCVLLILGWSLPNPVSAEWKLDNTASTVSFVSVKNSSVVESHYFRSLDGTASKTGEATLRVDITIDLTSVETLIPIRNERMLAMLFETVSFPRAVISTRIPLDAVTSTPAGGSKSMTISAQLDLHGTTVDLQIPLTIVKVTRDSFYVTSQKPVVIDASQFSLVAGIEALREVAGLQSITMAIPVSFGLLFVPVE